MPNPNPLLAPTINPRCFRTWRARELKIERRQRPAAAGRRASLSETSSASCEEVVEERCPSPLSLASLVKSEGLFQILLSNQRATNYIRTHPSNKSSEPQTRRRKNSAPGGCCFGGVSPHHPPPSPHAASRWIPLLLLVQARASLPQEPRVLRARIPSRWNRTDAFDCHLRDRVGRLDGSNRVRMCAKEEEMGAKANGWLGWASSGSRGKEERGGGNNDAQGGCQGIESRGQQRRARGVFQRCAPRPCL